MSFDRLQRRDFIAFLSGAAASPATATGAATSRTLPDRLVDVVNVKDFGAFGDGSHNDTAAIQAALDYAFGASVAPHGVKSNLNHAVFFPAGTYLVSQGMTAKTITHLATQVPYGSLRYTVADTRGLSNGDTVYITGVTCDGLGNGTRVITNITATTFDTVATSLYINSFTADGKGKVIKPALHVTDVRGGHIYGAGRNSTVISGSGGSNAIVFQANGLYTTTIERMTFQSAGSSTGTIAFLADMDGDATHSNGIPGSQGNTFRDVEFFRSAIGLALFPTNHSQGSENLIENCHFQQNTDKGLQNGLNANFNALQNTVIGGNFQACGTGISIPYGSVDVINAGFQVNNWDIWNDNGAYDGMMVIGCRTESRNFISCNNKALTVINCSQANADAGTFVQCSLSCTVIGCGSYNGQFWAIQGGSIMNSMFGRRPDFIYPFTQPVYVENCTFGAMPWGGIESVLFSPNFVKGKFQAATDDGTLYFIGKKNAASPTGNSPYVTTDMLVSDLPPAAPTWKGDTVVVFDSNITKPGSSVIGHGGGANAVLVKCSGEDWIIVG
jgi:Pectate lyase superfamily protein